MANKKSRERELAAQLFINTNMTQKEISAHISVSEKTISAWREEDKWDELKTAQQSTNSQIIADLKFILQRLIEKKKQKIEDDTYSKNDSDAIIELTKSIDMLESGIPLKTRIQVLEEFMDFIPHDQMKLKVQLADYQMKYLLSSTQRNG